MARRRRFTDSGGGCRAVGALLRRERLYSSHLSNWRQEVEASELASLQSKPRGKI